MPRPRGGRADLAIAATNGVVVAAEKKMPNTLIDESTVEKSALLSENVGVVYAGLAPDFRVLVRKGARSVRIAADWPAGRKKALQYFQTYKEHIPVSQIVVEMASIMQEFTQSG